MKQKEMITYLSPALAVVLLLCLAPMPYGYYQFVRFVAMVAFGFMAYKYHQAQNKIYAITFGVLALLFQPYVKIVLGREMWNIVDVVVALWLIVIWIKTMKNQKA